jgi:hypothetical protein
MPTPNLTHPHHTTADQALTTIKAKIDSHGYSKYVKWKGYHASVSVGFGAVLKMKGTNRYRHQHKQQWRFG